MLLIMNQRLLLIAASMGASLAMTSNAMHPAARGSNEFCFSMLDRLSEEKGNFVFSPVSVWSLLTLMANGTEGETREQMLKALSLEDMFAKPAPRKPGEPIGLEYGDANSFTAEWLERLKEVRGVQARVAGHVWSAKGLAFRPDFISLAGKSYGAGVEALDFSGDASGSARRINQWAADATDGRVNDLLGSSVIAGDARMMLTSTFSFDGKWAVPFDAERTEKRDFTLADGKTVRADTMSGRLSTGYLENDRLQAVRLRFEGMEASMIVLLPKKAEALSGRPFLTMHDFMLIMAMIKEEPDVAVQLPKFGASGPVDISAPLRAAGMTRAFSKHAQFGPACEQAASLSRVIHQSAVSVTEAGTGAESKAGSPHPTAMTPGLSSKPFVADHPFLFFIVDENVSGIVLAGRITNPTL